ncbi:MAG: hypothetical protein AAFP79_06365 [Pseudomonadota bacterium]
MSRSSNAFIGGMYRGAMAYAGPILFCIAVLLFVGTVAAYSMAYWAPMMDDDSSTVANNFIIIDGLIRATHDSALIFAGSAIIWSVNNSAKRGNQ